jgi:hypothetical protein
MLFVLRSYDCRAGCQETPIFDFCFPRSFCFPGTPHKSHIKRATSFRAAMSLEYRIVVVGAGGVGKVRSASCVNSQRINPVSVRHYGEIYGGKLR